MSKLLLFIIIVISGTSCFTFQKSASKSHPNPLMERRVPASSHGLSALHVNSYSDDRFAIEIIEPTFKGYKIAGESRHLCASFGFIDLERTWAKGLSRNPIQQYATVNELGEYLIKDSAQPARYLIQVICIFGSLTSKSFRHIENLLDIDQRDFDWGQDEWLKKLMDKQNISVQHINWEKI